MFLHGFPLLKKPVRHQTPVDAKEGFGKTPCCSPPVSTPPAKRKAEPEQTPDNETESAKKKLFAGMGGRQQVVETCPICGQAREKNQRGGTCRHCMFVIRKTLKHQRVYDVIESPSLKGEIKEKSLQERAKEEAKEVDPKGKALEDLIARLEVLVPKLEALYGPIEI